jgi:ankyrin repeat protein
MALVFPSICHWCVRQGRGAADDDVTCGENWTRTTTDNPSCIGALIAEKTGQYSLEKMRDEMRFLIAHGADPQYKSPMTGRNALHECARHGSVLGIKALMTLSMKGLSADSMLDEQLDEQASAHGYDRGSEERAQDRETKLQNEQGIDLFAKTSLGLTVVHLAAMRGHANILTSIADYLIENPSQGPIPATLFDAEDCLGFTASMYAAEKGFVNCLQVLHEVLCVDNEKNHTLLENGFEEVESVETKTEAIETIEPVEAVAYSRKKKTSDKMMQEDLSSFHLIMARPHQRSLTHYAALNNRVNVLLYLREIGLCHYVHQDIECRTSVDLAKQFNRLGAVAFLQGTCPHPYTDNNSHCGVCGTFKRVDDGPRYSPLPGHRNLTICDAIIDEYGFKRKNVKRKKNSVPKTGYVLWLECSNLGINHTNSTRSEELEVEELASAASDVLKHIGLEKENRARAIGDCVDTCRLWREDNDTLDSITDARFHQLVGSLPAVQALSDDHRRYVCR